MEVITITGHLLKNSELCRDSNGRTFSRFKISCRRTDANGETCFTVYRCYCYMSGNDTLKQGDKVMVTGTLTLSTRTDENKRCWINADVFVQNIELLSPRINKK